ncbi:calcium and integrin-binding protein 1-like [Fopius arisanus]|uniref:Calcium and integrin-binding protein 1-like n=1 Tax=Fopius arisanus TaxID=64838 RepID=A0A9R1UAJ4_9HYME|nr:PREDICTED: calcium and integrin-binding protein 1-like [Fopius arisanus]
MYAMAFLRTALESPSEFVFEKEDFDGDDMLGVDDLRQVIDRLTAPQRLSETDMQRLLQCLLEEADLDDDGALSFAEFEHIIEKSSDFSGTFRLRL